MFHGERNLCVQKKQYTQTWVCVFFREFFEKLKRKNEFGHTGPERCQHCTDNNKTPFKSQKKMAYARTVKHTRRSSTRQRRVLSKWRAAIQIAKHRRIMRRGDMAPKKNTVAYRKVKQIFLSL